MGALDSLTNYSTPAAIVYAGGYMNKPITGMTVGGGCASFWYMKAPEQLRGDVNGDGEVNIADINALIDGILSDELLDVMDVNGDGEVNIADVNALIALILSH